MSWSGCYLLMQCATFVNCSVNKLYLELNNRKGIAKYSHDYAGYHILSSFDNIYVDDTTKRHH